MGVASSAPSRYGSHDLGALRAVALTEGASADVPPQLVLAGALFLDSLVLATADRRSRLQRSEAAGLL